MRREFESILELAKLLPVEGLPELLGDLEQIRVTALARLMTPAVEARPDELLDITETSRRMGVGKDYLYRNSRRLPFARRIGRKLLFSATGLDAYLRKQR